MKKVQRLLWAIILLLAVSVAMNGYYFVVALQHREDMALRYTFSERAQRLARDIQWDRLLQVSLDRQKSLPNDPWGYFWAGVAHFRKGQFNNAKASFEKAVETDPTDPTLRGYVDRWLQSIREAKRNLLRKDKNEKAALKRAHLAFSCYGCLV